LILALLAVAAGILGKRKSAKVGLVLFCAGGILPLLAYTSNAERWPIPSGLELAGFVSAVPLVLLGSVIAGKHRSGWTFRTTAFWLMAGSALCTAIFVSAMVIGIGRIPA